MRLLAMDFGGSSVKYSVIDENGTRTGAGSVPSPLVSKQQYVQTIADLFNSHEDIDGVAISAPGYIDPVTGYIDGAGAYMQMMHTNLYDLLKGIVPRPVAIENDGKSGALAEAWTGALRDVKDGAVLTIGTGYAGGIIHDGKILRGRKNMAGEFSFVGLMPDLNLMNGLIGKGSMSGLMLRTHVALGVDISRSEFAPYAGLLGVTQGKLSELNDEPRFANGITGKMFFELLDEGNPTIKELYEEFIDTIAGALMIVQSVTDPEKIALGGAVTKQSRVFPDLRKRIAAFDTLMGGGIAPHINLVPCEHGSSANEIGAAYNWIQLYGAN